MCVKPWTLNPSSWRIYSESKQHLQHTHREPVINTLLSSNGGYTLQVYNILLCESILLTWNPFGWRMLFPPFYPCIKTIMTYLCIHKVGYKGHGTWCHVYTCGDMWWDHCKTVYHMLIYLSMLQAYRHSMYWRLCKQKKHWFDGCCNNVQASPLYIMTSKKFGECSKLHWVSEHGGTLYLWL